MAMSTPAPAPPGQAQPPGPRRPAPPVLNAGHLKTSIEEIKAQGGPPPWTRVLVRNERLTATFIYQPPGHQNDHHYHLHDEWWYVAEGELAWEMEGEPEPIYVNAGDFVFATAN